MDLRYSSCGICLYMPVTIQSTLWAVIDASVTPLWACWASPCIPMCMPHNVTMHDVTIRASLMKESKD